MSFAVFLRALDRAEANDPRPRASFGTRRFREWQLRHWERCLLRTELLESAALSTEPDDPAPLAREGLAAFLDWIRRKEVRQRAAERPDGEWRASAWIA